MKHEQLINEGALSIIIIITMLLSLWNLSILLHGAVIALLMVTTHGPMTPYFNELCLLSILSWGRHCSVIVQAM